MNDITTEVVVEKKTRNISPEERARRSAFMKEWHEKRKGMPRKPREPKTSVIQVESMPALDVSSHSIRVDVNWQACDLGEAQQLYAKLKREYERAGSILNDRLMPKDSTYICFMCKTSHPNPAKGIDYSRRDPKTGLMVVVQCCGEICWRNYQQLLIKERRERELGPEA